MARGGSGAQMCTPLTAEADVCATATKSARCRRRVGAAPRRPAQPRISTGPPEEPSWALPPGHSRLGTPRRPALEWPPVAIADTLARFWQAVLDLTSQLVIPDWAAVVGLLPVFLVLLVLGPLLTLLAGIWLVYLVRRPKPAIEVDDGPWPLEAGPGGALEPPLAQPYCPTHRLVFRAGTENCPLDGAALLVLCPKCRLARPASVTRCGNCGLVAIPGRASRPLVPASRPPGGAAVA